jgi:hypothetical protein
MKPILSLSCLLLTFAAIGCGGTTELPAGEGGQSTATPEEISKQMEAAKAKSMGAYKGNMPTPGGQK